MGTGGNKIIHFKRQELCSRPNENRKFVLFIKNIDTCIFGLLCWWHFLKKDIIDSLNNRCHIIKAISKQNQAILGTLTPTHSTLFFSYFIRFLLFILIYLSYFPYLYSLSYGNKYNVSNKSAVISNLRKKKKIHTVNYSIIIP